VGRADAVADALTLGEALALAGGEGGGGGLGAATVRQGNGCGLVAAPAST